MFQWMSIACYTYLDHATCNIREEVWTVGIWLFGLLCSAFHFQKRTRQCVSREFLSLLDGIWCGSSSMSSLSLDKEVCLLKQRATLCSQIIIYFSLKAGCEDGHFILWEWLCFFWFSHTLGIVLRELWINPCWAFEGRVLKLRRGGWKTIFFISKWKFKEFFFFFPFEQNVISPSGIGPRKKH